MSAQAKPCPVPENPGYLTVINCGTQSALTKERTVSRPHGSPDYHILYVIRDSLPAEYGGKEYRLNAGDFMLYAPGEPQRYVLPPTGHPSDHWIHFVGTGVPALLDRLGFAGSGVYRAPFCPLIDQSIRQMIFEFELKKPGYEVAAAAGLALTLTLLSRECFERGDTVDPEKIRPVLEHISANFQYPPDLSHLASLCNLSRSRFTHLFREITGTSPVQYYRRLRVERAREYLLQTGMSISEISDAVGYADPLYFSRVFRKTVGVSPAAFRRGEKRR